MKMRVRLRIGALGRIRSIEEKTSYALIRLSRADAVLSRESMAMFLSLRCTRARASLFCLLIRIRKKITAEKREKCKNETTGGR